MPSHLLTAVPYTAIWRCWSDVEYPVLHHGLWWETFSSRWQRLVLDIFTQTLVS